MFFLSGFEATNSLATFTKDILSVSSLWKESTAKELKRFWVIVAQSHVFNLRARENDRSGVALVAAPTRTNFINLIKLPKRLRWCT